MRYLIINADDYGLCADTNKAVEEIFNHGVLSSATIMAPCPGAYDGVARALANPKMNIGMHITTTSEWQWKWGPVSPKSDVPSLVNWKGVFDSRGHLYSTAQDFAKHAVNSEVTAEMEAQYKYLTCTGLKLTHADSHMGSVYGLGGRSFMKETLEFCAKYKLPFRFPRSLSSIKEVVGIPHPPPELITMHEQALAYADALGVKLIDHLRTCTVRYSELTSYEKLKENYFGLISSLQEGVSEIFMHPSLGSSQFGADNPRWQARIWEHRLLLDDDLKAHIEKEKIVLTTYQDAPAL